MNSRKATQFARNSEKRFLMRPSLYMKPRQPKMAARTGTLSILMILPNNRGLWTLARWTLTYTFQLLTTDRSINIWGIKDYNRQSLVLCDLVLYRRKAVTPQVAQVEIWASALLRNIRNLRIYMWKKPIVPVTYKNERISIINSSP